VAQKKLKKMRQRCTNQIALRDWLAPMNYRNYSKTLALLFASAALLAGACGTKSADGSCTPGSDLCACTDSGGCDNGLVCATNLNKCVQVVSAGSGGDTGSGGAIVITGAGGGTGAGGSASGGATGAGGSVASGGATGSGGSASGGMTGTGGAKGGTTGSGGAAGAGAGGARGGATGSGGAAGGGAAGTSGARGGTTGSGGTATGGATGSGGATATACNLTNHSGSGSFTYYWFGQGTAKDGSGYRTACGYYGTESGMTDTVQNVSMMSPASNTYFAAIPGQNGFDSKSHCGECVQITGQNGKNVVATIIDECPYGSDGGNSACANNPNGHLDLSYSVFNQLGYSVGNPSGTTWKFVPCPVTGNVIVRVKPGNPNELFIENTILNVTAVDGASKTSYGTWHFGGNLSSGQTINLTDGANRTLSVQLKDTNQGENQDTGKQFPACQ
jgi:expansin (peptidoglycan-binding protein)